MAKKLSLSDLTNESRRPSWAVALRQQQQERRDRSENALSATRAMADQLQQDEGVVLPESQIRDIASEYERTGEFNFVPKTADFSGVTSSVDSTATLPGQPAPAATQEQGLLSRLGDYGSATVDAFQSGLQNWMASGAFTQAETAPAAPSAEQISTPGGLLGELGKAIVGGQRQINDEQRQQLRTSADQQFAAADANRVEVQKVRDSLENRNGVEKWTTQAILDAAESPTGALSLIGGPTALVGVMDVHDRSYAEARRAGLSEEDAGMWALSQAAPELISFIPAGKIFGKTGAGKAVTGGIAQRLASPAMRSAIGAAKTMAGEGAEEAVTGALGDLTAAALAGQAENEKLRSYASDQLPKSAGEFVERRAREAAAGAVFGTLGSVNAVREGRASFNADVEARTAEVTDNAARATEQAATATPVTPVPRRAQRDIQPSQEAQMDLFPETQPGPNSTVPEKVTQAPPTDSPMDDTLVAEQRRNNLRGLIETEQANIADLEARQKEAPLLREAGYDNFTAQDEASLGRSRERLGALQNELGRWSGAAASQPVLPLSTPRQPKPKAPTSTQTRGGDTYYTPEGERRSNVRDSARKEAEKALQTQAKADEAKVEKDFKAAQKKYQTDRKARLTALTTEARSMPEDQRIDFITDGITDWDSSNQAPVKGQTPVATAAPVVDSDAVAPATATPKAPVSAKPAAPGSTDAVLEDITRKLSLGMQEANDAKPEAERTAFDSEAYRTKIREVVGGLAKANTQQTVDAVNLINQGKLVLAPTPESIGREASEDVAQYDPRDGKMYMYTDRLNPQDTLGAVIRTYHESTHAGQFNDRTGRPDILRHMMGKEKSGQAQQAIVRAANSGNRLAQAAVRKAQEASGGNIAVENLELLPYFVGEVVNNRGTTLGQLRGVGADVLTSARNFVRKATGKDFDVDWRDLQSAVDQVGGEIVQTDLTPQDADTRGMIYGETAQDFEEALNAGRVYTSTADGTRKFVLSDADSRLTEGAAEILGSTELSAADTVPMHLLMRNETLYRNMPEARNIQVRVNPLMKERGMGAYWPGQNLIEVSRKVVEGNSLAPLRDVLTHEIQHWVQDQEGGLDRFQKAPRPANEVKAVREYNAAKEANDAAGVRMMQYAGRIVDEMPGKTNKAVARGIINSPRTPTRKALDFSRVVQDAEFKIDDIEAKEAYNQYADTLNVLRSKVDPYNEAATAAHARYAALPTESEAFFSQRNVDTPQADLPINPEMEDLEYGTVEGADVGRMAIARELRQGTDRRGPQEVDETAPAGWATALGMAANTPEATERRVPTWLTGLLRADKGLGKLDNEIIEHAIASPAGARMKAEAEMGKYDVAVNKQASMQGKTTAQLNKEIEAAVNALPKDLNTHAENVAAFNAAMQPFGEAGRSMMALRDQVDDLTMSILQQRADSGVPLTEQEKALYKTLVANMGRYTHRQYAAHAGKLGSKYANAVYKDYQKVKAGKGRITPVQQANYQKVADAVKYLVDNNLNIPDDTELATLGADQTRRLYDTWGQVGNPDALSLDQMKDELAVKRDALQGDSEELTKRAEGITQDLLGLTESNAPISTYYRGGKQDNSILKQRENIPPVLRALMGEITDPSMRMVMTVAKQAEFVGRNRMLLELAQSPSGDVLPPGSAIPDGWTKVGGEGWGPLKGHIVSPNMMSAIGDVQQQLATFEQAVAMSARNPSVLANAGVQKAFDTWGNLAATSKMLQVIWSPMNFVYNFVGGPFTMLTNGNVSPINFGKGALAARDLISYAVNPKAATTEATRLVQNDVVDSAFVGEIKNEQYRELRKVVMNMAGRGNPSLENIGEVLHKAKAGFKETYAMMDVLYKVANFYHQVDTLSDFYQKNGDVRTPEQIDREAADVVKRTNFTYRRVAPLLKAIESKGFSAFGPYMHEVFRTQIAGVFQGISEVQRSGQAKTPEARNVMMLQGVKRLSGLAATWGMIGAASSLLSGITFGEDDDENEAKRSLLPEYLRDQDFVEIGKDAKGNPVMFNVARFDPIGPATDLMRGILQGGIDPDDMSKKMMDLYVTPRIGPQLVRAVGATIDRGVKPTKVPLVQELAPEQYSTLLDLGREVGISPRVAKAWTNVAETLYPGIATAWRSTNARPVPTDDVSSVANTATYLGMQLQSLDPAKSLKFSSLAYKDAVKFGRRDLVEMFADNPDRTGEEVLSYVLKLRESEKKAYDELKDAYDGAVATGISPRQVAGMLKEQKVSGDMINSVRTGNFASGLISPKSLTEFEKKELVGKTREEQREIKQKWKDIRDLLKSTSRELKEEDEE